MKCERGNDEKGYAVFHHDTEHTVEVKNKLDDCRSNRYLFKYAEPKELIDSVISKSDYCQQHTKAVCKDVWFLNYQCTQLIAKDGQYLNFWGGGPQDGTGCACGLTSNCTVRSNKCNCDYENGKDQTDKGFVTLRGVLPLTGIAVGDVGHVGESFRFTIGPVMCVI